MVGGASDKGFVLPLYSKCLLSRRVTVNFAAIGNGQSVKNILLRHIRDQVENKCTIEGFVHPNTCNLISFSGGTTSGSNIRFDVVFECDVCSPSEGSMISCIAKNITHAGIRAMIDSNVTPVVIYVARDHHFKDEYFESIVVGDTIRVKVIGQRFELNDKHVSIIGELVKPDSGAVAIPAKRQHQHQHQHQHQQHRASAASAAASVSTTPDSKESSAIEARNADIELIRMIRKNPNASHADISLADQLELEHSEFLFDGKVRKNPPNDMKNIPEID